jgi:hypothetical protein
VGADVRGAAGAADLVREAETNGMSAAEFKAGQVQALADIEPLRTAIAHVFSEVTLTLRTEQSSGTVDIDKRKLKALDESQMPDAPDDRITWMRQNGLLIFEPGGEQVAIELEPKLRPEVLAHIDVDEGGEAPRVPLLLDVEQPNRDGGAV